VELAATDLARETEGPVDVLGPDRGRRVVPHPVGDADGLALVAKRDGRQHRPDLLEQPQIDRVRRRSDDAHEEYLASLLDAQVLCS
jgi:hypothetical protein